MPYIDPNTIQQLKKIDLLSYLRAHEPQELMHLGGDVYCTKTHDSLKISNGKWMWWSRGFGGNSALEYLIKVKGLSFYEAAQHLASGESIAIVGSTQKQKPKQSRLLLPKKHSSNDRVIAYLTSRGIDLEIISHCIEKGLIFESLPMHNAVFVGMDEHSKPRYANYRGTGETRYIGDAAGSDKNYSFRLIGGQNSEVHLFESAVDLLSYATLLKLYNRDWKAQNLLSLAGIYQPKKDISQSKIPKALEKYLAENNSVTRVVFHFDNDTPGKTATKAISCVLPKKHEKISKPPPKGKDFNDYLCLELGIYSKEKIER